MAFGLRSGWSIEPPPDQYATGPTQSGHTVVVPNLTPEQAHAICQAQGTFSNEQQGYGVACYVPTADAVVMPDAKYWPSKSEIGQMLAHEMAHARGWRHNPDGTGTGPTSLPPPMTGRPPTPAAGPTTPPLDPLTPNALTSTTARPAPAPMTSALR